jgi:tetratricopeptide (TPR) repeat protein
MDWMSLRAAATALLVLALSAALAAQGVPGSKASLAARQGWDAIRDGRNADAASAFAEAVAAEPRDPSLHLGAGLAAYLLGRRDDARTFLREALTLAPNFTSASLLLGEILYRDSEADEALRVYEAAQQYAPRDATLAARIEQLRNEAALQQDFFRSQGSHFTVLFEGPADEALAQRALDVLEEAYFRIGTALYTFPERPITVVLYTTQQFTDVTRSPQWAAAAYDGQIRVPMRGALERPEELQRVLAHEFTHALIQTIAPRGVPTWLNEGLAVAFEPEGRQWSETTLAQVRGRIPLQRLTGSFAGFSDAEARVAYAESADAVRQLLDQAGPAAIVALLQDIAQGRPLAAAFAERTLRSYDQFAASLVPAN